MVCYSVVFKKFQRGNFGLLFVQDLKIRTIYTHTHTIQLELKLEQEKKKKKKGHSAKHNIRTTQYIGHIFIHHTHIYPTDHLSYQLIRTSFQNIKGIYALITTYDVIRYNHHYKPAIIRHKQQQ